MEEFTLKEDAEMGIELRDGAAGESMEPLLRSSNERRSRSRLHASPSATSLAAVAEHIARNEADRKIPKVRIPSYSSGLNNLSPECEIPEKKLAVFNLTIPEVKGSVGSTPMSTPSPLPHNTQVFGPVCRWRRSDRRLRRLNTELMDAIEIHNFKWAEKSLNHGASPNATCRMDMVSACHIAALFGADRVLALLLERGAERHRVDRLGRTPLHLAAWGNQPAGLALLLGAQHGLLEKLQNDITKDVEDELKDLCQNSHHFVNERSGMADILEPLPKEWKCSFDHDCRDIKGTLPLIENGWTPLHVASARARPVSVKLLIAAGANIHVTDFRDRTPLDVAGTAYKQYPDEVKDSDFVSVIRILLQVNASHNTMKAKGVDKVTTPLHIATAMESLDGIRELLGAGAHPGCLDEDGETPLHLCVKLQSTEPMQILVNTWNTNMDPFPQTVDLKNAAGYSVLQSAVMTEWIPGVCVALEAGADVAIQANDGETPIHAAAALGNLELLDEILSVAKRKEAVDCPNATGETPLFKAIASGHVECVKALMNDGASINKMLPGDVTTLHKAAEYGHVDILYELLVAAKRHKHSMVNFICSSEKNGFAAIHFAAFANHPECLKLLLSNGADVRLRTTSKPHFESTPLHIASMYGHVDCVEVILNFDKYTIHEVDLKGWYPIHNASHHGRREVIPILLRAGADLSSFSYDPRNIKRTAIDMLINNLSRPTDYLEELFDSYITINGLDLQDSDCEVHVDYSILMPKECEMEQMKVIVALMKTGNRFEQKRLLLHPLVESFLYLKWKALSPFFYTIVACYAFFVSSLTFYVISIYYFYDTHKTVPPFFNTIVWQWIMVSAAIIIVLQELLYMKVNSRYFLKLETWVKFGSVAAAVTIPFARILSPNHEWPRHVATLAVLLAWTELMFLLSRFPNWGYYVLMFSKVAVNVIKVLLTFAFLVIGFSLSFMIQFRSREPFESPWAAFVKTIVMMTSEFDYVSLFDEEHTKDLETSIVVGRIIFMTFLILAAIVLMNLLVGVAVSDINDLEIIGKMQRLAKQVDFLGTLDVLVYNKLFSRFLPKKISNSVRTKRNVAIKLIIYPGRPTWKKVNFVPRAIRDSIFIKATKQKMINDEALALKNFSTLIDEIHEATVKSKREEPVLKLNIDEKPVMKHQKRHEEVIALISTLTDELHEIQEKVSINAQLKTPIQDVNRKLDQMHKDIDYLDTTMKRLTMKVDAIAANLGIRSIPSSPF